MFYELLESKLYLYTLYNTIIFHFYTIIVKLSDYKFDYLEK